MPVANETTMRERHKKVSVQGRRYWRVFTAARCVLVVREKKKTKKKKQFMGMRKIFRPVVPKVGGTFWRPLFCEDNEAARFNLRVLEIVVRRR